MSDVVPKIGSFGFAIILTILNDVTGLAEDISAATTKTYNIRKPSGTVVPVVASFYTDGTDGKLTWTVTSGFLDESGPYTVEAVVSSASFNYPSTRYTFTVGTTLA